MKNRILTIAKQMRALTFNEMMEVADYFSAWTGIGPDGENIEPTLSREQMACNLNDWADCMIVEREEQP